MRIVATSDLHGHLPDVQRCDLLLIAGDVCPIADHSPAFQRRWLEGEFADWIESPRCRARRVLWIAGNHDLVLELGGPGRRLRRRAIYLLDRGVSIEGLNIYGTPWSKIMGPWAFSLDERITPDPRHPSKPKLDLEAAFSLIPEHADVVLCHQPPYGILDQALDGTHCGSPALNRRLDEVRPRLVVFGHIHEAYGRRASHWIGPAGELQPVTFINASHMDARCRPVNRPQEIEL